MKLNIGAGSTVIDGFIPVDRKHDNEAYPLPSTICVTPEVANEHKLQHTNYAVGHESVEEIRASHVLEHFAFVDVDKVLAEWMRVMKPGAVIKIAVPDYNIIQQMRSRMESDNGEAHELDKFWPLYLMGGQTDDNDFHRSMFTEDGLRMRLEQVGFVKVEEWEPDCIDTASHPVSLRLQATKPIHAPPAAVTLKEGGPTECEGTGIELKIAAVMSIPRLGFNDNWGCVTEALAMHGIPVRRYTGAFWNQCIQNALNDCIKDGVDWALTIDYDSMFTWKHVDALLGSLAANPEIHALAAMQCRRSDQQPLMSKEGGGAVVMNRGPVKCATAHFGLTLIRLDDLAEVPKPWFVGEPDKDGGWTHWSRLDPDMYFWDKWKRHGKSIYVDPAVRIGHLEMLVSEYDEKWKHRHVTVEDWRASQPGAPTTRKQT